MGPLPAGTRVGREERRGDERRGEERRGEERRGEQRRGVWRKERGGEKREMQVIMCKRETMQGNYEEEEASANCQVLQLIPHSLYT